MKNSLKVAAGVACFLSLQTNTNLAGTYYVDTDGKWGNTGTKAKPWNLPKALDAVDPGDTVYLSGGVYDDDGALWIKRSGRPGKWITFRAGKDEVPIIKGPGPGNKPKTAGVTDVTRVSYVRIEGLWVTNWHWAGIGIGWYNRCHHIELRHNVADLNGQSGLFLMKGGHFKIEYNIASRNGYGPDSWGSGVGAYQVHGSENTVRGNVSFSNIDSSDHHTDGNGFILDVSKNFGNALFENNIGFNNGGACIVATDSSSIRLANNTCWHNAQDPNLSFKVAEFQFSDTKRDGNKYTRHNVTMRNNVAIAVRGHKARSHEKGFSNSVFENNYLYPDTKLDKSVYNNPGRADFRPGSGSALINAGTRAELPTLDIGFDPRCIKRQTLGKKISWAKHAPNLDYIVSIGGIKNCFSPRSRTRRSAPEIGAYKHAKKRSKSGRLLQR